MPNVIPDCTEQLRAVAVALDQLSLSGMRNWVLAEKCLNDIRYVIKKLEEVSSHGRENPEP